MSRPTKEIAERRDVGLEVLGGDAEVALRGGLLLGRGSGGGLGLGDLLVAELDLVLEGLLQHREGVQVGRLL